MSYNAKLKSRDGEVFGYAHIIGNTLSTVRVIKTLQFYLHDVNGFDIDVYDSREQYYAFIKTEKVRKVFKEGNGIYTFSRRVL